ncbi:hypothetical protein [Mycolicibacterium hippocampi]
MDRYGLQTWHDYASLAILLALVISSTLFVVWERRTRTSRLWRRLH